MSNSKRWRQLMKWIGNLQDNNKEICLRDLVEKVNEIKELKEKTLQICNHKWVTEWIGDIDSHEYCFFCGVDKSITDIQTKDKNV
jgi:hypothetical protein